MAWASVQFLGQDCPDDGVGVFAGGGAEPGSVNCICVLGQEVSTRRAVLASAWSIERLYLRLPCTTRFTYQHWFKAGSHCARSLSTFWCRFTPGLAKSANHGFPLSLGKAFTREAVSISVQPVWVPVRSASGNETRLRFSVGC